MRFVSLQCKDVVDAASGSKIGYVVDVEIDPLCRCVQALIVERVTPFKLICIFKGPPTFLIPIENIITIGEDVILVNVCC
ncbi:MAG: YlmC/YmxH family sporulation protein [Coprobacillus sp.]